MIWDQVRDFVFDALSWIRGTPGPIIGAVVGALVTHFFGLYRQKSDEKRQHRIARLVLVDRVHDFIKTCNDIVTDHYHAGTPLENFHSSIPVPRFIEAAQYLSALPPNEAERLVQLTRSVVEANESTAFLIAVGQLDDEEDDEIQAHSARLTLTAIELHDELAKKIGWKNYQMDDDRRRFLAKIVQASEDREMERVCQNARMIEASGIRAPTPESQA